MLSTARALRQSTLHTLQCRRSFAQVVNSTPSTSKVPVAVTGFANAVDWRKERVPVREDHGLYAFFRRKDSKDGKALEGDARFEAVEAPNELHSNTGRGWRAEELRLKSFKDLHVLWYVLLRERNLLATQKEEARRMGVEDESRQVNGVKVYHVRKSMARIKAVINERRLAYEQALGIVQTERDVHHDRNVLAHLRWEHRVQSRRARREAKLAAAAKQVAQAAAAEQVKVEEKAKELATPKGYASHTAVAGLFGNPQ